MPTKPQPDLSIRLFRVIDASRLTPAQKPYHSLLIVDRRLYERPDAMMTLFTTNTPIIPIEGDEDFERWVSAHAEPIEFGDVAQVVGVLAVDEPRDYPTLTEIKALLMERFGVTLALQYTQTIYVVESHEVDPTLERPTVGVEITGPDHSGKTVIAAIIANALQQKGFDQISIDCQDGDLHQKHGLLTRGDVHDLFAPKPVPAVHIRDRNPPNKE